MSVEFLRLCAVLPPLLVLPILGIWLLKTGIWPRRQGKTPYCAGCGYNLTGLTSERCPECGRGLAAGGIVHGERRRSPGRIIGGIVFMLPLAMIATLVAANIDWYRIAPTFAIVSDLESENPTRSWNELDRRIRAGSLSASQRSRVIDIGLKEQVSVTASQINYELMNQLGKWAAAGQMSNAQARKLYDQIVTFAIRVRPKVVAGDYVPAAIRYKGLGPSNLTVQVDDCSVQIDGKATRVGSGASSFSGRGVGGSSVTYCTCSELGRHTIEANPKVRVFFGPTTGSPLHQRTVSLQTAFEVVAPAPEYAIRLNRNPALKDAIRQSIRPEGFEFGRDMNGRLTGTYKVNKVPANVAFEVFARIENKEHPIGNLQAIAGESTSWGIGPSLKLPPFTQCDLIFRSNEKVARETVDLYEIWQGELQYNDVPVKLGPYATTKPTTSRSHK